MNKIGRIAVYGLFTFFFLLGCTLPGQTASPLRVRKFTGRVLVNNPGDNPFRIRQGEYPYLQGMEILTLEAGQLVMAMKNKYEVRLKQETIIRFEAEDRINFSRGTLGIKSGKTPVSFRTPHCQGVLTEGIVVIKTNPVLTRVCLIDGNLEISGADGVVKLKKDNEIAVSDTKISLEYKRTAELRFTWYWKENPDEEPTFN